MKIMRNSNFSVYKVLLEHSELFMYTGCMTMFRLQGQQDEVVVTETS